MVFHRAPGYIRYCIRNHICPLDIPFQSSPQGFWGGLVLRMLLLPFHIDLHRDKQVHWPHPILTVLFHVQQKVSPSYGLTFLIDPLEKMGRKF